jgi:hypothetical protein
MQVMKSQALSISKRGCKKLPVWIEHLFAELACIYNYRWTGQHTDNDMWHLMMGIWEKGLVNYIQTDIRYALSECHKRPNIPTLPDFRALCETSKREREQRENINTRRLEHNKPELTDFGRAQLAEMIAKVNGTFLYKNPIKDAN